MTNDADVSQQPWFKEAQQRQQRAAEWLRKHPGAEAMAAPQPDAYAHRKAQRIVARFNQQRRR